MVVGEIVKTTPAKNRNIIETTPGKSMWCFHPSCTPFGYEDRQKQLESISNNLREVPITTLSKNEQGMLKQLFDVIEYEIRFRTADQKYLEDFALTWTIRLLTSPRPLEALKKLWEYTECAGVALIRPPGQRQPFECVLARWTTALDTNRFDKIDEITNLFFKHLNAHVDSKALSLRNQSFETQS